MKKIDYNSPVVLTFFLISLCALLLGIFTSGVTNQLFFSVYRSSLTNPLTYVRVFTHVLGHGGISHFFNNMMFILLIGPILEEKYGWKSILAMILITALATGVVFLMLFPNQALLGASGVVFMLIVLASFVNIKQGKIPVTLILITLLYLSGEIYNSIFVADNVSQLTHLIGGGCGAIFGFLLNVEN
ncbi:MAG: rhomboid family intramembrane serine protease [Lachnospirales bacterium]